MNEFDNKFETCFTQILIFKKKIKTDYYVKL